MNYDEIISVLKKTDPFEILDDDALEDLSKKIEIKTYLPNSYIFRQGEQSLDKLFIIASGMVEITVTNDRGFESVVGLRRANDFFGETVILSQQRYPGSARVKLDMVCIVITRKQFEKLIYSHSEFSSFFNALLTERMRLLYEEITSERSYPVYRDAETPLFGKKISEIMSYPVVTCSMKDLVSDVARTMSEKDISAVVVVDKYKKPKGLVTETSLVKYLVAQQLYPVSTCRVEQVVYSHIVSIGPESFIGQALVSMIRNKTRYLVVMERGKLVGIIAMVDLIKLRSTAQMLLSNTIESQQSIHGLAALGKEVDNILRDIVAEKADLGEILDVLSELNERLTQRVIELSEERMRLDGWGPPPVDYCWMNLGSAARYEQLLRLDQDNAILYADPSCPDSLAEVDSYFKKFAEIAVEGLYTCGFEKCRDGISPVNQKWRRSQSQWLKWIRESTKTTSSEDSRMISILLDFRPVWGNKSLSKKFEDHLFAEFRQSRQNPRKKVSSKSSHNTHVGFLGTIVTEKDGSHKDMINLKKNGILNIVNSIRILAAFSDIRDPSTLGRLENLVSLGVISEQDAILYKSSFEALMLIMVCENMKKINSGVLPDNFIDPYSLRKRERIILKDSLSCISQLQKQVTNTLYACTG